MNKGRLIVVEGIDGSGKTTQVNLLSQYLKEKQISFEIISFPRYEDNIYGKLIKRYLEGEFGSIDQVNPYLLALAFAGDRLLAKPTVEKWLSEGKIVIANRYTSSSKAHLGANLLGKERLEFLKWLDELEYQTHDLPQEDLTILLDIDPAVGQKNVLGKSPDLHEESIKHLKAARKIYLMLAKSKNNWYFINCADKGMMKPREEIHQEIIKKLK